MTPWGALLILAGVVVLGAAICGWALLSATAEAEREWERLTGQDDD